jgi:hypothetical protein
MTKPTRSCVPQWLAVAGLTLTLGGLSGPAEAQTIRSTLTGTVTEPNGAVVTGDAVTATNLATNIATTTKTTHEGL